MGCKCVSALRSKIHKSAFSRRKVFTVLRTVGGSVHLLFLECNFEELFFNFRVSFSLPLGISQKLCVMFSVISPEASHLSMQLSAAPSSQMMSFSTGSR